MNIESTNLVSVVPGVTAVDGMPSSLLAEGTPTEGFTDALKMQIQLMADTNKLNQIQGPLQNSGVSVLTEFVGDVQELADLIGNDLPVSYKINDEDTVNANAALSVVQDSLKYLEVDAVAFSDIAQMSQAVISQSIQAEANADEGQLQVSEEGEGVDKTQEDDFSLESAGNQEGQASQVMSMIGGVKELQSMPPSVGNASADGKKDAVSMPATFSVNGQAKTADEINQIKSEEPLKKESGQETQTLFDASIKEQVEQGKKAFQNERQVAVGSSDVNIASPVVNGKLDNATGETKAEVPAMTKSLGHPEWNKDLGERIVWMNNRTIPAAEIKLNPQHLGPVSVRIDLNQDQASIVFTAQHASVRDALEASMPKLREMLNDQQINLVNVSVSQNGGSEQRNSQSQYLNQVANSEAVQAGVDEIGPAENERVTVSNGLLNMYA